MPMIGDDSAPALSQYRVGNIEQQGGVILTMPEDGTLLTVGCYLRGVSGNGSIQYGLAVWNTGGGVASTAGGSNTLGAAAVSAGNLTKVTLDLDTPVFYSSGDQFIVGFATDTRSGTAAQWGKRSTGTAWFKDLVVGSGGWSGGVGGAQGMSGRYSDAGAVAAWVENYSKAVPDIRLRRSGAFVQATAVRVRRSGAWVDVPTVRVRRGGIWVDL